MRREQGAEQIIARLKLKEEFIANAIHKLRTPIAIIKGNVDLNLREKNLPAGVKKVLREINLEIKDLSSLLSDLTYLIRKDADFARPMVIERQNIFEVISKVIEHLKPLFLVKKIKIIFKKFNATYVQGDRIYLEKLFNNLIGNAIKYTKIGGKILISNEKRNGFLKINIKDNGMGIRPKDMQHIFDRFYRAKKIRTVNDVGTGLGLPIARSVAEMHGGSLEAESVFGQGSTFIVTLPLLPGSRR